jgi:hypothetical protein
MDMNIRALTSEELDAISGGDRVCRTQDAGVVLVRALGMVIDGFVQIGDALGGRPDPWA